jgi:BirA family biotin operon repressor/biotin-[acetyl-CoA-carboxylase] ligase
MVLSSTPVTPSLNIPLLDRLRAARGDYVPLGELSADLVQLRDDLDALALFGFGVEQHPYRGAAFTGPAQRLCPDQIDHGLSTRWLGRRIAVWNRVTSTNDLAVRAGNSQSNDGLTVLAEEQTAGRGRRGRSWCAPPYSSILMSVLLFPPPHLAMVLPETAFGCAWLTALGAVAAAEVVTAWTGREAAIKWPNDVRIEGRKIAGILVERVPAPRRTGSTDPQGPPGDAAWGAVIGIGLNVNVDQGAFPPELSARATSMQIESGGEPIDRSAVARDLIVRLDHWYDASRSHGVEILNQPWRARSEHLGRSVRIETAARTVSGHLVDIDLRLGLTVAAMSLADRKPHEKHACDITRLAMADVLTLEDESSERAEHRPAGDRP